MAKFNRTDIYAKVTDTIIEALESPDAVLPWRKPWRDGGIMPRNGNSGRPYNGVNTFYLWAVASKYGWTSNDWFTFRGAKKAGGTVRRGEKSKAIVVYFERRMVNDDRAEDGKRMVPFLRHFVVFNREQCDGRDGHNLDRDFIPLEDSEKVSEIEKFIRASGANIGEGGQACYIPSQDKITLPPFGSFEDSESYYSTALHELSHWTGHGSRLDRDLTGRFGNKSYSAEELVAEFSSAFLCNMMQIDGKCQHTEYINNWIRLLREDKKAIFRCCTEARKASDYLLDLAGIEIWDESETVEA